MSFSVSESIEIQETRYKILPAHTERRHVGDASRRIIRYAERGLGNTAEIRNWNTFITLNYHHLSGGVRNIDWRLQAGQ